MFRVQSAGWNQGGAGVGGEVVGIGAKHRGMGIALALEK